MDDATSEPPRANGAGGGHAPEPRSLEQLVLAGLGWLSLGAQAADELADELTKRVGTDRIEMRAAVRDTISSWRNEIDRLASARTDAIERALQHLGLVRREEADDLALRIAQLEHRLRLLEQNGSQPPA